jgi:hypothetical protein
MPTDLRRSHQTASRASVSLQLSRLAVAGGAQVSLNLIERAAGNACVLLVGIK